MKDRSPQFWEQWTRRTDANIAACTAIPLTEDDKQTIGIMVLRQMDAERDWAKSN